VGFTSPWLLLVLTFALSAGDAFETPTWRAILPELVPKDDLPIGTKQSPLLLCCNSPAHGTARTRLKRL
jgi:hypothetical protein